MQVFKRSTIIRETRTKVRTRTILVMEQIPRLLLPNPTISPTITINLTPNRTNNKKRRRKRKQTKPRKEEPRKGSRDIKETTGRTGRVVGTGQEERVEGGGGD